MNNRCAITPTLSQWMLTLWKQVINLIVDIDDWLVKCVYPSTIQLSLHLKLSAASTAPWKLFFWSIDNQDSLNRCLVFSVKCNMNKTQTHIIFLTPWLLYWIKHQLNMVNIQTREDISSNWKSIKAQKQTPLPPHTKKNPTSHPSCRCRIETEDPELFTVQERTGFCSWTASWQSTPTTERNKPLLRKVKHLHSNYLWQD